MPDDEAYEERLRRLLERLERALQIRKHLLGAVDARDILDYNAQQTGQPLPALLVLIDNFAELKENFETLVDEQLVPLLRQGRTYGLYFFITANDPGAIPGKVYNLLGKRLTFSLADSGHYLDIAGRSAPLLEPLPGRGLVRVEKRPLTFQSVLPVNTDHEGEGERLRRLAATMRQTWSGAMPEPIRILPRHISLRYVLHSVSPNPHVIESILGLTNDLVPTCCNLQRNGPHFAVVGPPLSGKTTTLTNWVLSLATRYRPEQVGLVLIDLSRKFIQYGGEHTLADLPHVLAVLTQLADLPALVTQLAEECRTLAEGANSRRLFVLVDNFDDLCEEVGNDRDAEEALNELALLASRHGTDGLHIVLAGMLDAPHALKKRVLAGGYGLGLRDADSLTTLRAYTRGFADLPLGRGFIVTGGQLMKVQVALPYDTPANRASALDQWVHELTAQYTDHSPASWKNPIEMETAVSSTSEPNLVDNQTGSAALALLKQAVVQRCQIDGVALADLGIDLDTMEDVDVLRFAETYFPVEELA